MAATRRRPRPVGIERYDERSDARERALLLLYEAESKGISALETIDAQVHRPDADDPRTGASACPSTRSGSTTSIAAHCQGLDARSDARHRPQRCMRIAGFELLGRPDVPVAVVLDEAVELAKRFSHRRLGSVRERCAVGARAGPAADGATSWTRRRLTSFRRGRRRRRAADPRPPVVGRGDPTPLPGHRRRSMRSAVSPSGSGC